MIKYTDNIDDIEIEQLEGFFVGWPNPPRADRHLELLRNSEYKWLAIDEEIGKVVGFITAISDKVLCAYIPLLEVLPEYQAQGIGRMLVDKMLNTLSDFYMIDLLCDDGVQPFYEKFKLNEGKEMNSSVRMVKAGGRITRNYKYQDGAR